ncbi:MAG: pyruvate kinase, partial [Aquiluna sp.]
MRRAKIVATFGPALSDPAKAKAAIEAGVDIARMNLSHGDHSVHEKMYSTIREAAAAVDKPVGILVDLQGPKIRLGRFANDKEVLEVGQDFTITTDVVAGDSKICSTTYKGLPKDVKAGDSLLLEDGRLALTAVKVEGNN